MEREKRAFTLIELLVVIAVITLLMAILFPALQHAKRQAKVVVCQSNLRQWGKTLAIYTQDNQGRFPLNPMGGGGVWILRGAFISGRDPNQPDDSFHHFPTKDIVCCPMATKPKGGGGFLISAHFGRIHANVQGTMGSKFAAWEIAEPGPPFHGSYGFNDWLFRGFLERPPPS